MTTPVARPKLPKPPRASRWSRARLTWVSRFWDVFAFNSVKKKLAVAISTVVVVGVSLVLVVSIKIGLGEAESSAVSNNQKSASSLSLLVRQIVETNNTRARSWVVQARDNDSLEKLLEGDSTILGVEVVDASTTSPDLRAFQSAVDAGDTGASLVSQGEIKRITGKSDLLYREMNVGIF